MRTTLKISMCLVAIWIINGLLLVKSALSQAALDVESTCTVSVNDFSRTSRTSPDLIRLQSALIDPDTSVSKQAITTLARRSAAEELGISLPEPRPTNSLAVLNPQAPPIFGDRLDAFHGKYLDILLKASPEKKGAARAESFKTVVESQFLRSTPMSPDLQNCFASIAARIFPELSFETQWTILNYESYQMFKSRDLTAYLRRLYDSLEDHLGEGLDEDLDEDLRGERFVRFYRGLILRRIYEEDPIAGREMVLNEIASGAPRVNVDALAILPDQKLPEIDEILRKQIAELQPDSDGYEALTYLGLIERYASDHILQDVKSVYMKHVGKWGSDQDALFLSYFVRTDPSFARWLTVNRVKKRKNACIATFSDIARVRISAQLGEIAKDYIEHPDPKIAADAAYIFKWVGNAEIQDLLWKNMQQWHERWSHRTGRIPSDDQDYGDSLAEALLIGSGPCLSKTTIERLRPLYIKDQSVDGNIQFPEWHDPIRISADSPSWSGLEFRADFCDGLLDLNQLMAVLPRFPKGTNFKWMPTRRALADQSIHAAIDELQSLAASNGMSLRRSQEP